VYSGSDQEHADDREYHSARQMPDLSAANDERAGARTGLLQLELGYEVGCHRYVDLVNRQDRDHDAGCGDEPWPERLREQQCGQALRLLIIAQLCAHTEEQAQGGIRQTGVHQTGKRNADPCGQSLEVRAAMIGIHHPAYRARAIDIGERLEVLKDYPTPPNCTSPFAPIWIDAMVRRQGAATTVG